MKAVKLIALLVILCSLLPLGIAGYWYQKTDAFLEKAVKTEAVVVDMDERTSENGTLYYPVFTFSDRQGQTHRVFSKSGSYPPSHEIGDTIAILYDPQDPGKTRFDSFVSLWLGPVILGVLGLIPVILGGLILLLGPILIRATASHSQPPASETSNPEIEPTNHRSDKQGRTWAMFCHLAALSACVGVPFGNVIGPLVVWLIKRDEFAIVDAHGKESLNFQISLTLYAIIAFFLCFALIGFLLLPLIFLTGLVFVIIATVKANDGEPYRYPLTIRFIKGSRQK